MANWPIIIDDDGTGTAGTPTDKALFDQIKAYVDVGAPPGVIDITTSAGGFTDIVLPSPRPFYYVKANINATDLRVRSATAGRPGDVLLIGQVGGGANLRMIHNDPAGYRAFYNRVASGDTPLALGGAGLYVFDGNLWVLAHHEQGRAITIPYSAANYTTAAGSWSVPMGAVVRHEYVLSGNELQITLYLGVTTLSTSTSYCAIAGQPFTWTKVSEQPMTFLQTGWLPAFAELRTSDFIVGSMTGTPFGSGTLYISGVVKATVT